MKTTNWKTTVLGVCAILTAVGQGGTDLITTGNLAHVAAYLPALLAGIGLIFAHDASAK